MRKLSIAIVTALVCLLGHTAGAADPGEAIFAGGCFWCIEASLEKVPGVLSVVSGYTGGKKDRPSYEEVGSGSTGHAEAVRVRFDPSKLSYAQLLQAFWHNIDPLSAGGQFCDRGNQYRSGIFYLDEAQRKAAESSRALVEQQLKAKIVTELTPASAFFPAEDYHQDFYKKNPARYTSYRTGCGRDRRLQQLWGAEAGAH